MANITDYLNGIKSAVYGKEVRGAIHDAIKQVYDDASVNHDNANMEVKMARGTHNTLNDRLDNVDEIQAQTNAQLSNITQLFNVKNTDELSKSFSGIKSNAKVKIIGEVDLTSTITLIGVNNVYLDLSELYVNLDIDNFSSLSEDKPMFRFNQCENINLFGVKIDGKCVSPATTSWKNYIHSIFIENCSRFTIDNIYITNYFSVAIIANNNTDLTIKNSTIKNGVFHGVSASNNVNIKISNNILIGCGKTGTNTDYGGIGIGGRLNTNVVVDGNIIENWSDTGSKFEGGKNISYINNKVEYCGKDGLKVQGCVVGDDKYVYDVKFLNNTVKRMMNNRVDGTSMIRIHDCKTCTVQGNIVDNTGGDADRMGISGINLVSDLSCENIILCNNICITKNASSISFASTNGDAFSIINGEMSGNKCDSYISFSRTNNINIHDNECEFFTANQVVSSIKFYNNNILNGNVDIQSDAMSNIDFVDISNNKIYNSKTNYSIKYFANNSILGNLNISNNDIVYENLMINSPVRIQGSVNSKIKTLVMGEVNLSIKNIDASTTKTLKMLEFVGSVTSPLIDSVVVNGVNQQLNVVDGVLYLTDEFYPDFKYVGRAVGKLTTHSIPTAGKWFRGEIVYNSSPQSGRYAMWQCVSSGSPGTWVGINQIP